MRIPALVLDDARGHFGIHREERGVHELVRDPLGVHKLFFAIDDEGGVHSATYFADLRAEGFAPGRIWSVPSGHRMVIDPRARTLLIERLSELAMAGECPIDEALLQAHAARITHALEQAFESIARALSTEHVYVTLSGGLDSTGIAVLAQAYFPRVAAITFAIGGEHGPGSDLASARRVAKDLGIELVEVIATREEVVELLDDALVWGQDWRDFNVHCALVNAALAEALPEGAVILTGDGMNELMADYSPVKVGARTLYGLPRLSPGKLRRVLVAGLDAGDREIGVFARRGIRALQPYLLCADAYTALPDEFVASEGSKQALVKRVLGDRVPAFVYERPKVRAQVGSSGEVGGTVRALLDRGIDQARLAARFRELLGLSAEEQRALIRAGFYRFPTRWPEDIAS